MIHVTHIKVRRQKISIVNRIYWSQTKSSFNLRCILKPGKLNVVVNNSDQKIQVKFVGEKTDF